MTREVVVPARGLLAVGLLLSLACAGGTPAGQQQPQPADSVLGGGTGQPASNSSTKVSLREPVVPPRIALLAGLLPMGSMGVDTFRLNHPGMDGRGVLIGILDSGVDPGLPGFARTSDGRAKILDLRDFSGEGRIELTRLARTDNDTISIGSTRLAGFGRIARLATGPYFGGTFRELPLGTEPAADINGNGSIRDEFPVVVAKSSAGWFAVTDTDGDGAIDDEMPIRDFAVANETFSYVPSPDAIGPGPITIAVNFSEGQDGPVLDLYFDTSSHGTHVAGVAAGHDMFGVEGFDGVAPGAQILGLKIANNARGGISVSGSIVRAMDYAVEYAQRSRLPLVLNLSYGVGNELEGAAIIDSLIDDFALANPDVLFVISAGNDGPGLSTIGFPASAEYALAVCGLVPGVYSQPPRPGVAPPDDVVAWWSARGGELAKPDLCAPGVAYSNVPLWHTGDEIQPGTSFSAPQIAGAAALLQSGMLARGWTARAIDLKRALMNTAVRPEGTTVLDVGSGVPNVGAALRWLMASHQAGVYSVRALSESGNGVEGTAAYRRDGLTLPGDTLQRFVVSSVDGQPAAQLELISDVDWIEAPSVVEPRGQPVAIDLRYDPSKLTQPGLHVGTVWARPVTDTMSGPSFSLINTVVVPQSLDFPFATGSRLGPGGVHRYFLEVPPDAGGLEVRMTVKTGEGGGASLFLFEPSGQPQRGVKSVLAEGKEWVSINVAAEDLIPGVYEAAVVPPAAGWIGYEFEAALPQVSVTSISNGPTVTVRNTAGRRIMTTLSAEVVGVSTVRSVGGKGSAPWTVQLSQPRWADRMVMDVALPEQYWNRITDFGVTLFDSTGAKLLDSPLNYAFGRQTLSLDSLDYRGDLLIELLPAYARLDPHTEWQGELRVDFLLEAPVALDTTMGAASVDVRLGYDQAETFRFPPVPASFVLPEGFKPIVEVTARTATGPVAVRRAVIE
jgi:tripeptidyl-peptidase-2